MTSGNRDLENECSRLQEEWLGKERSYHLLCAKDEIATSKIGNNLAGLGSLKELYERKIAKQQDLVKELRAQQQGGAKQTKEYILKQNAGGESLRRRDDELSSANASSSPSVMRT